MVDDEDEGFDVPSCVCISETDKAILVLNTMSLMDRGSMFDEAWIPKSVLHDDSEVFEKDGEGTLVVKSWWAEKQRWL